MSEISRRAFLAGTGAAALAGRFAFAAEDRPKITSGADLITLGKTGIKTSVLGIGTGTRGGAEQRAMGEKSFTKLARHALDRGVCYIDTAGGYSGMHAFVAAALKGVPRENYFLQSKTRAKDAATAIADVERFRKELKVDTIDTVLMHCLKTAAWPTDMRPVIDALSDLKQKGHIRAVGISSHGMAPLAASIDVNWIEVQLARINPFGSKMDGKPADVARLLKKAHATGRGMLGMKIFGESGYDSREKRAEALKYVLGLGSIQAFTIGFSKTEQIDETLELIKDALAYRHEMQQLIA